MLLMMAIGCSVGKRAQPIALPQQALQAVARESLQDPLFDAKKIAPDHWWDLFGDRQLATFIKQAFSNNPTLHAARAKIFLAAAAAGKARSALYPHLHWSSDVSRQKLSETAIIPFQDFATTQSSEPIGAGTTAVIATGGVAGIPVYFTQYETAFSSSYDFDLWGKNRNALCAAKGEMYATIADEAFSQLQLGIAVARAYFRLQIAYQQRDVAKQLVDNRLERQQIVQKRMQSLDNRLARQAAETNTSVAKKRLLQIQADIIIAENQLRAYLAGNFQERITPIDIAQKSLPSLPLPCNLPMHLLAHRPDIAAHLWLIKAAGKRIQVAQAGFYPDFNLSALLGFQTIHLKELFKHPSMFFTADPAVSLPFFDAGLLQANLYSSEAQYDITVFNYNEALIQAAKEVLDALALLRNGKQQLEELSQQRTYEQQSLELAGLRLIHSINSRMDYLASEEKLLLARTQEIASMGEVWQAALSLIKALGGYNSNGKDNDATS